MTRTLFTARRFGICIWLFLVPLVTPCIAAPSVKRVLILDPYERYVAPFSAPVSTFRSTLPTLLGGPVDFYEVPLDLARFGEPEGEAPLVAFLEARLRSLPVDLVVAIGSPGFRFVESYHERLFSDTPILSLGNAIRPVDHLNASLVTQRVDLTGIIQDVLQMQPETTQVAVVFGASRLENFWVSECRREFQPYADRVTFTYLNDLTFDELLKRCAALPPRSFILYLLYLEDAAGVTFEGQYALRRLHETANAPIFGYFGSEFGLGPIGGRLYRDYELGTLGARTAVRILGGERPEDIPPLELEPAIPVYDWRELQRWRISESRLPAGSVVEFRQPGIWERYHWPISAAILLVLLQAVSIIGLLKNRARLTRAEAEATMVADISSKFVNLPAGEVDREIIDAARRVYEFHRIDMVALWQWSVRAGAFTLTHFFTMDSGAQLPMQLTQEEFPWVAQQMQANRIMAISSLEELPPEAGQDRESARMLGIKSSLLFPLSVGGESPAGVLALNDTRAERCWNDVQLKRLQLVAQIIANALSRSRSELALRESEARFRMLVEQAPEAILVYDAELEQLVQANYRAEELFGCSREELLAYGPRRFYVANEKGRTSIEESMRANIQRALSGETVVFERTIRSALGQHLDCEVRLVRLPGTDRRLVRGSFIDITDRKKAEATLHNLGGRLIRAHEEERARLARELHDDVTQRLAHLAICAGQVKACAEGPGSDEALRVVREGLGRLSDDIHSLSYRLHPSLLRELGLAEALKSECSQYERQDNFTVTLNVRDLPAKIPAEAALCLFRVAQEALRNVVRHGQAHGIEVSIRPLESGLQLAVVDDGIGFDPGVPGPRHSLGLASMRERLLLVGGELEIESAPGEGTAILAWVPLEETQS